MKLIRCLATDLGRVVGTFDSRADVLKRIAQNITTARTDDINGITSLFSMYGHIHSDEEMYYDTLDTGSCTLEDLWIRFRVHFKLKAADCPFESFRTKWCNHHKLIEPVVELYRQIQKQYPLIAVSNGDKESLLYFTELAKNKGGLQFHKLYLSALRHQKKPALFDTVARDLEAEGIKPRECLYIDDRMLYVRGAWRRNFRAFHFDATDFPDFNEAALHLKNELIKRGLKF